MREIKFRVWDNVTKEFLTGWKTNQLVIRPLSGRVTDGGTTPNVTLMQYTGLKDKNGREIYEGDVLSISNHNEKHIERVYFEDGAYCTDSCLLGYVCTMPFWNTEVIGNIYENPELLEVTE